MTIKNMDKQKYVSPALMWLFVLAGAMLIFLFVPAWRFWRIKFSLSWLFLPVVFYWLYFFIGAIKVHKQAAMSVAKIDRIVKEGVYAYVRHPIYHADITLVWGISLFMGEPRFFFASAWLTAVLVCWMMLEEKAMEKKFGREYLEYKKQVPMFCPRLKG
jgi:protein-S-isoprenylcysteine O-methyltransferase Ste14